MSTNILLIGGAGFIGHHLAHYLKEHGEQVCIYDSFTDYQVHCSDEVAATHKERRVLLDSVPIKTGDMLDKDVLEEYVLSSRATHIVFLASFPRQATVAANPILATTTMTTGLVNALEVAVKHNIQKFVFISSSMVYGDFSWPVDEDYQRKPNTLYGILKAAGEDIVNLYHKKHKLDVAIVRPTAVYGPRDLSDRLIPTFFNAAIQDQTLTVNGEAERLDFTYVADVAAAIAKITTTDYATGTFNVSAGHAHSIKSAAEIIIDLVGYGRVKIANKNKDMPSRSALIINRARSIGYSPLVPLKRGLKEYWQWLKNSK